MRIIYPIHFFLASLLVLVSCTGLGKTFGDLKVAPIKEALKANKIKGCDEYCSFGTAEPVKFYSVLIRMAMLSIREVLGQWEPGLAENMIRQAD
jgi:hypothetical protein